MEQNKFIITGGNRLEGSIEIESSKNAILPIIAASIMCESSVIIENITYYDDVLSMIEILKQKIYVVKNHSLINLL